jgi:hypothetical protein
MSSGLVETIECHEGLSLEVARSLIDAKRYVDVTLANGDGAAGYAVDPAVAWVTEARSPDEGEYLMLDWGYGLPRNQIRSIEVYITDPGPECGGASRRVSAVTDNNPREGT